MKFAKDQIAHQFSRAATTYDGASQLQIEMADRLIQQIPVDAYGRLVDLGCGTGFALEQISRFDQFELTGIDIARRMIELAQTRVPTANFICADLEETPLSDDYADVVFSNAALQWCDTSSALREIHRIIRPGGFVLVSTFGPATLRQWRSAWQSVDETFTRVHDFESVDALRLTMDQIGFREIEIASVNREFEYVSVDAMFQSIKRLGATNAAANRHQGLLGRHRYQQVVSAFEDELRQNGKLTLTFECVFISAKPRLLNQ